MKTTSDHFKLFRKTVQRLLIKWGLVSWEQNIRHEVMDPYSLSETHTNIQARLFIITLNKDWIVPINEKALKEIALHEVLEVLLSRLENMVRPDMAEEAREEVHAIIQTIINVMGDV